MTMRLSQVLLLGSTIAFAVACEDKGDSGDTTAEEGGGEEGGGEEGGGEEGGGEEGGGEEGGGGTPNPYTTYEGWESFDFYYGEENDGRNCQLVWEAIGTPVATIPSGCVDCQFVFDVAMGYDAGPYEGVSTDDGTCAKLATDASYYYGYTDAYGYGLAMFGDGAGYYGGWAYGEFDGTTFTYYTGYDNVDLTDYGYPGYFYTYWWYGTAELGQ